VEIVWQGIKEQNGAEASNVRRIYSEWEPSQEDNTFIQTTFPSEVAVGYSFRRPGPDGWEKAMQEVGRIINQVVQERAQQELRPRKKWWQFWK
jgi:hypothetical protein